MMTVLNDKFPCMQIAQTTRGSKSYIQTEFIEFQSMKCGTFVPSSIVGVNFKRNKMEKNSISNEFICMLSNSEGGDHISRSQNH